METRSGQTSSEDGAGSSSVIERRKEQKKKSGALTTFEDLEKAQWHLTRELKRLRAQSNS
jgi:hypothetical protein